jgi:chemotaxis signal transduction protein
MSDGRLPFVDRASNMRAAFDRSFAEARRPEAPAVEGLLAIRIGSEPYALRLSEIAGLYADRAVTRLPGDAPALLGIAGFRGAIVPVYDLPALLGHRPAETTRWLAMAAGPPVAFAFAALDGHLRVALDAIVPRATDEWPRQHIREFARTAALVRPIVHLPSVLAAIGRQTTMNVNPGER